MSGFDYLIQMPFVELSRQGGVPPLPHQEVERIRCEQSLSPSEFLNTFARHVAHDYLAEKLSFEVADVAMNSLSAYALKQYDVRLPSYAWEVYLAFDQGEFRHPEDDDLIDPEEKYTRPEIQSIVVRDQILGVTR
ncbi:MAG: hypothetical protein JNN20_09805 [Betaproteobacteria bacterium]|nr:hypothetical protein [Betaproteobacteria bacterium]